MNNTASTTLLVVIAACFAVPALACQEGNDQEQAEQFLTQYWESGKLNRESAADFWESSGGEYSENPQLLLAYIANRMKHNQYRDAQSVARRLTEVAPANVRGWELRVWLDALVDDFDQSLVGLREFRKKIDEDLQMGEAERVQYIRRMGRLYAYLEGPVGHKVNPDTLMVILAALVDGLTPEHRAAFDKQRQLVAEKYAEMQEKKSDKISSEEDRLSKIIEQETKALNETKSLLDQQIERLSPQMTALQEEANRQASLIRQEMGPLQSELGSINASINDGEFDLTRLNNEYFFLRQISPQHINIPFVLSAIRNQRFNLSNLYTQARSVQSQLAFTQNRLIQTQREFDNRAKALRNEIKSLEREINRSQKRLNKLAGGPKVASGKIEALNNRNTSIITYDQYPVELFRQDLLDRLDK